MNIVLFDPALQDPSVEIRTGINDEMTDLVISRPVSSNPPLGERPWADAQIFGCLGCAPEVVVWKLHFMILLVAERGESFCRRSLTALPFAWR